MSSVTLEEAQVKLPELIHNLSPGEELVIIENNRPVARLVPTTARAETKARGLGTMRGTVLYMAPDFDTPLDDFKEYMD